MRLNRLEFIRISIITVSVYTLLFISCKKDNLQELIPPPDICDSLQVSYSADIEPIINTKCAITACHVAGGIGVGIFDSYSGVKAKVDNNSFEVRVLLTMDMPQGLGPLPDNEKDLIQCWLNAGAPNN